MVPLACVIPWLCVCRDFSTEVDIALRKWAEDGGRLAQLCTAAAQESVLEVLRSKIEVRGEEGRVANTDHLHQRGLWHIANHSRKHCEHMFLMAPPPPRPSSTNGPSPSPPLQY